MKIRLVVFSLVLLFLMSAPILGQTVVIRVHTTYHSSDDVEYHAWEFPQEAYQKASVWKPETDENPPFSVLQAMRAARAELKKLFPELVDAPVLDEVRLIKGGKDKIWMYAVNFNCLKGKCFDTMYVLMNGTVSQKRKITAEEEKKISREGGLLYFTATFPQKKSNL